MNFPAFVGSSNAVRSPNVNAETTINLYLEMPPGAPKVPGWLQKRPGIAPYVILGDGPIRCLFFQNGRGFGISSTSLYEIFANYTATLRGTVEADGVPATISSNGTNGNQLFITTGGKGYIYNLLTNTGVQITDPDFPVQVEMGAFSDGYFLALKRGTNIWYYSALNDGLLWDGLDFNQVSTVADHLVALIESHREIWTFGSQTTSVWANTGDADNPFEPIPGVKIQQGCGAAYSALALDNTVFWLGGNEHGNRIVYRAKGYTPERISTHAVEYALNHYPRVDDAIMFGYQDEGHLFCCLLLPTRPDPDSGINHTTWCYDVATGQWHQRAQWNSTSLRWEPWRARCHMHAFGKHFIGDAGGPGVYELSLKYLTDYLLVGA